MKFLFAIVALFASLLTTEAYLHQMSLGTFNFDSKQIRGDLSAVIKGENSQTETIFNEISFFKYKNVMLRFSLDEEVKEIILNFDAKEDENAQFVVGPIVIAVLDKSESRVFKPNTKYISGKNKVRFTKVDIM